MKKTMQLFVLLFVMVFAMTACDIGRKKINDKPIDFSDGPIDLTKEYYDKDQTETRENQTNVKEEASAENAEASEDTPRFEEADPKKEFSLGKRTSNTYESEFIGMGYRLDAGWKFYSDQQIRELNDITMDYMDEEYESLMRKAAVVYDMFATDSNERDNIYISLQKTDQSLIRTLDIKKNYNLVAPILVDTYKNMGYQNVRWNIVSIEVDGRTIDAIKVTASISGVNMYQTVFHKKCKGYIACVAVTTGFTDSNAQLIDNIYWLD